MAGSVLRSANIEVHASPVLVCLGTYQRLVIVRIHISQIVGGTACKARHGALFQRIALVCPVLCPCQWRFSAFCRFEGFYLRKFQRKGAFRKRGCNSVPVADRERFSPISLARENGIAEAVIDCAVADSPSLHFLNGCRNSFLDAHSGEESAVCHNAFLGIETLGADIAAFYQRDDLEPELLGKGVVSAVVCRNGHDRAGSVTCQNIFRNPYGNLLLRERIHRPGT